MRKNVSVISVILFAVSFLLFQGLLSHVPVYHEQHHLFLFSALYVDEIVHNEGLATLISNFVIQFFCHSWAASLIYASILSSMYMFLCVAVRKITHCHDWLNITIALPLYFLLRSMSVDYPFSTLLYSWLFTAAVFLILLLPIGKCRYAVATLFVVSALFYLPVKTSLLWIAVVGLSVFSAFCFRRVSGHHKIIAVSSYTCLLVYALVTSSVFVKTYNMNERREVQLQGFVRAGEWENVYELSKRCLDRGWKTLPVYYYHNMSLVKTGRICEHLFDYPQYFGSEALLPSWSGDRHLVEFAHYAYADAGCWNIAHRWAFEAMVMHGETAPILSDLALCNIKMRRFEVADKIITKMAQTLFYQEEARNLRAALIAERRHKRTISQPKNAEIHFFNKLDDCTQQLSYVCQQPELATADVSDYLISYCLLRNDVAFLIDSGFLTHKYSSCPMPQLFQQAVWQYMAQHPEVATTTYKISPNIKQHFEDYRALFKAQNFEALKLKYGKTFWFYKDFYCQPNTNNLS